MTMQEEGTMERIQPTYGYYRQPDGFITLSPATELEELHYMKEGWGPLRRYGRVEMCSEWVADHPLETLFLRGGAHELSAEQIERQGLYMNPPLLPVCRQPLNQFHKRHSSSCWVGAQPVTFPQIAHMELQPAVCRFCQERRPTAAAISRHEDIMHKDEKGDIRTGETLASGLLKGLEPVIQAASTPSDSQVAVLVEELRSLRAELDTLKNNYPARRRKRAVA